MLGVQARQLDQQERIARGLFANLLDGAGRELGRLAQRALDDARAVLGAERAEPQLRQHLVAAGAAHLAQEAIERLAVGVAGRPRGRHDEQARRRRRAQ